MLTRKAEYSGLRLALITHEFPTVAHPDEGCVFYDFARELQKHCAVRIFCLSPSYPRHRFLGPRTFKPHSLGRPVSNVDVTFVRFPSLPVLTRPLNAVIARSRAQSQVASWQPDAILAYFIYPQGCAAVSIGERLKIPVILGARGSDLLRISDPFAKWQISRALRSAAAVTGVSQDLVQHAIRLGADPEHSVCILNGCHKSIFHPRDKRTARRALGLDEDQQHILFVGRLVQLKGIQDLIHALALLKNRSRPVKLLCVGQGPMERDLSALAGRLGVNDQVVFAGPKRNDEIGDWLGAADLLCLPSYSEGSPNVILEALSSGRPVVASAVGGIPDLIDDRCGILVPPRSPDRLAAALGAALDRSWDAHEISLRFGRAWSDVARDTLNLCSRYLPASLGQVCV
jgi:teichuronic acid biosynthesis glycosyltransferase TuaC